MAKRPAMDGPSRKVSVGRAAGTVMAPSSSASSSPSPLPLPSAAGDEDGDGAPLAESLREVVGRLVRSVRQASGTQASAQGDTLAQLDRSGPLSVAALADSRGVSHQSMRLVVARMEVLGQIERRPDPADGRGFLVELTASGKAEAAAGRQRRSEWLAQAIAASLTPQEQDTLRAAVFLLDRLAKASPTK